MVRGFNGCPAIADLADDVKTGGLKQADDTIAKQRKIVGYQNIQFTKAPNVLRGMGLGHLEKSQKALDELAEKGMAPD